MAGENCTLMVNNYGTRHVKVESFDYGVEVLSEPGEARNSRVLYTRRTVDDAFMLTVVFGKHQEYQDFFDWMVGYGQKAAADASTVFLMQALIPDSNFNRIGIPKSGIQFGDATTDVTWRMVLNFQGARDPVDASSPIVAQFVTPVNDQVQAPFFYPGGIQLSGFDLAADDGAMFGLPTPPQNQLTAAQVAGQVPIPNPFF